jgi:hypothetical protein
MVNKTRLALVSLILVLFALGLVYTTSRSPNADANHLPRPTGKALVDPGLLPTPDVWNFYSSERPEREDQLNIDDLHVGDILYEVYKDGETKVLIIRVPYMKDGHCVYDRIRWGDEGTPESWIINSMSCSDSGLTAYQNSLWNRYNYMRRADDKPLTKEEVQKLMKDLIPFPETIPPRRVLPQYVA